MTFLKAILMGIIQGLTEFLPVSSSGHLAIGRQLLGIPESMGLMLEVMLHLGTLIAICYTFRHDIRRMIYEFIRIINDLIYNLKSYIYNKVHETDERRYRKILRNNYSKMVVMIAVSSVPTAVIGFLFRNMASKACHSLLAAGLGMMVTAVLLLVVDYWHTGKKIPKDINMKEALAVGVCQGISVIPGLSRAGFTITGGLLCGWKKNFAVKYSFLMSVPAIIGALILEISHFSISSVSLGVGVSCFFGMLVAAVTGLVGIRLMLKLINKKCFKLLAAYCFFAGIAALIIHFKF